MKGCKSFTPYEGKTMRTTNLFLANLLIAGSLLAQDKPADAPHKMDHMQHAIAKGVKLEQKIDGHTIVVRIGPMTLPAHTNHMKMPQPPDLEWQIPIEGWLLAYSPKLVDGNGNTVPG